MLSEGGHPETKLARVVATVVFFSQNNNDSPVIGLIVHRLNYFFFSVTMLVRLPPVLVRQPPMPVRQPPTPVSQPPMPVRQPPMSARQPPMPVRQTPMPVRQPPMLVRQPPMPVRFLGDPPRRAFLFYLLKLCKTIKSHSLEFVSEKIIKISALF